MARRCQDGRLMPYMDRDGKVLRGDERRDRVVQVMGVDGHGFAAGVHQIADVNVQQGPSGQRDSGLGVVSV